MLIEQAISTVLAANAGLTAIVGTRIYAVVLPQFETSSTVYPALVWSLTARERRYSHDGPNGMVASNYEFDCVSRQYLECKQLADAVRLALNGKGSTLAAAFGADVKGVYLDNEMDSYLYDEIEQLSLFHVPMEFRIEHMESLI